MKSLPVRLFHASLSGILAGFLFTLLVFHMLQRFHRGDEMPMENIVENFDPPGPMAAAPSPNDLDGDEIPNDWETQYHHDPSNPDDAAADFDNDGLTAAMEFAAGTNPLGNWDVRVISPPNNPDIQNPEWDCTAPNSAGDFALSRFGSNPTTGNFVSEVLIYRNATDSWEPVSMPVQAWSSCYALDINEGGDCRSVFVVVRLQREQGVSVEP